MLDRREKASVLITLFYRRAEEYRGETQPSDAAADGAVTTCRNHESMEDAYWKVTRCAGTVSVLQGSRARTGMSTLGAQLSAEAMDYTVMMISHINPTPT